MESVPKPFRHHCSGLVLLKIRLRTKKQLSIVKQNGPKGTGLLIL